MEVEIAEVGEKNDATFELTQEIMKLLEGIKEETISRALQQLGVSESDCNSLDKPGKMKKFEKITVYNFGVGRLMKLLQECELTAELEEILFRHCKIPLDQFDQLRVHIEEVGLVTFLRSLAVLVDGTWMLDDLSSLLGLPTKSTNEDSIKSIADEIMLSGTEELFNTFTEALLQAFILDLKLLCNINDNKRNLVDCIMVHAFELEPLESFQMLLHGESDSGSDEGRPLKKRKVTDADALNTKTESEPENASPKAKTARPPIDDIVKGITQDELQNNYNLQDIKTWCRGHELPTTGKKSVLIRNILAFLNTGARPKKKSKT